MSKPVTILGGIPLTAEPSLPPHGTGSFIFIAVDPGESDAVVHRAHNAVRSDVLAGRISDRVAALRIALQTAE